MKRRSALKLFGGALVVAAGGAGYFASTRTPALALAPWQMAGDPGFIDPRMRALSYAVLAPNPHNRQPWLIELDDESGLTLRFDQSRQLPYTDPFDRQLTIGLGCFLELLKMAANADGQRADVNLFPEGSSAEGLNDAPVAEIHFSEDSSVTADPLWLNVLKRRTNKSPFDTSRQISSESLESVIGIAVNGTTLGGTVDESEVAGWRETTERALAIEIETPHTYKESVDLFRIGKQEVEANPDGIDFSGPLFEALHVVGAFSREAALDTDSATYKQGMDAVLQNCRTAMGVVWMTTQGNSRQDQIAAGGDWLRVNLACTAIGLGFQPLSQALQEYPEMQSLYQQTHQQLAPQGSTVQMLARIGYGDTIAPSPRWPVESRIAG